MSVRTVMIAAVAAALLLVPGVASAQRTAKPYSVHEFRLGATLSDFRQIKLANENRSAGELKLVCSNDEDTGGADKIKPSAELQSLGAIKCSVLLFREDDEPVIATLNLFGERVECEFLFYRPRPDKDYRLTQMTLAFPNRRFQNVIAIFRRAYGQPTGFDVDGITTAFGNDTPNATYIWDNVVSTIRLDMFSVSLDRMSVIFVHNELWTDLGARLRRLTRPR